MAENACTAPSSTVSRRVSESAVLVPICFFEAYRTMPVAIRATPTMPSRNSPDMAASAA